MTFFSGTDTSTLRSEGSDLPNFVSLIVNNTGNYTAAITRKVVYKEKMQLQKEGKYRFFSQKEVAIPVVIEGTESEKTVVEWFDLEVVKHSIPENAVMQRFNELKERKRPKSTSSNYPSWYKSTSTSLPGSKFDTYNPYKYRDWEDDDYDLPGGGYYGSYSPDKYEKKEAKEKEAKKEEYPNLFGEFTKTAKEEIPVPKAYEELTEDIAKELSIPDSMFEPFMAKLLKGTPFTTKLDKSYVSMGPSLFAAYEKVFGKSNFGEAFKDWVIVWYDYMFDTFPTDDIYDYLEKTSDFPLMYDEVSSLIAYKALGCIKLFPDCDFRRIMVDEVEKHILFDLKK